MKTCEDCKNCGEKRDIGCNGTPIIYVFCKRLEYWTNADQLCSLVRQMRNIYNKPCEK